MKYVLLVLGGLLAALFIGSLLAAAARDSYDPTASARSYAESARYYAEAERTERAAELDRQWAPIRAAVLNLALLAIIVGGLLYLASLGVAHVARFRHERMPRRDGMLPVLASDQATARAALGAWHTARITEAQQQPVPSVLTFSPHSTHAPRVDYRADAGGAALAPPQQPALELPGVIDLGTLGHQPTRESILLGLGAGGERITVPAKALCHVALVGATGGGKSNLLRLLLPQLQAIGARVVLADPHFAPLDPESGDDWRPIAERLHLAPAVKPAEIGALLSYLTDELARRLELRNAGQPVGPPLFFAFDELPVIADTVPGALDTLGKIVREGRKVHLLAVGASQTMLVKAIGGDSTIRDNYRTAFYVGGDLKSGSALLDLPQREIAEGELQTGIAYLRSASTAPARLVRVPYASNEAVYGLLGVASEERPLGFRPPASGKPDGSQMEAKPEQASSASVSPKAAQVFALFCQGLDVAQIVAKVYGVDPATGGRRYQDAARDVQRLLREALGGAA
jgi:hypothetical protein